MLGGCKEDNMEQKKMEGFGFRLILCSKGAKKNKRRKRDCIGLRPW